MAKKNRPALSGGAKPARKVAKAVRRPSHAQRERAARIFDALSNRYPDAHCELDFTTPHELLVATILSAQATDISVNKVTPALFKRFPTPAHYAQSTPQEIEALIKSIGLFRSKAKALHASMQRITEHYHGRVPDSMEELLTLRGVARKTANVVLGNAFGRSEGVVVDTHVVRVGRRFGLTKNTDPRKIELDLMALFPPERWTMLSHLLIFHGRRACRARNADCATDSICIEFCANAAAERKAIAAKRMEPPRSRAGRYHTGHDRAARQTAEDA